MRIQRLVLLVVLITLGPFTNVHAQDSTTLLNWLEPPPFLEGTDLFWTLQDDFGSQGPQSTFPHSLEADIFPHFILAFGAQCRNTSPDVMAALRNAFRPCISITPAVRLRMLKRESTPVPAPSFMPRVNVQWLFRQGNNKLWNVYAQVGHHSNGQSGCLFVWTGVQGRNADCVDYDRDPASADQAVVDHFRRWAGEQAAERPDDERGLIQADRLNGNFAVNYVRFGVDWAIYRSRGISWRLGASYEHTPDRWMFRPLRQFYPDKRFDGVVGFSYGSLRLCRRLDLSANIRGWRREKQIELPDRPMVMQLTCVVNEEQGVGFFVRYYRDYDYYNASFLDNINRLHVGFTINRLKAFGLG